MAQAQKWEHGHGYQSQGEQSPWKQVQSRHTRHTVLTLPTSFESFTRAFEAKLSRYNLADLATMKPFTYDQMHKEFTAVLNGQPFVIFAVHNFGPSSTLCPANLNSEGTPKATLKGVRYILGNVIYATAMTSQRMSVELHVPPTVAVWENQDGWTVVEWDSLADQIGEEAMAVGSIGEIATKVDDQREQVVWEIFTEAVKSNGKA